MAGSFADQLLKAGLVNKQSVQNVKKAKHKVAKLQRKGNIEADNAQAERLAAQKAEQVARDRQLNLDRLARQREKEIRVQAMQLLSQHQIAQAQGDIKFHYTDAHSRKIKSLYVTSLQQEQLARGLIAICLHQDDRVLVPRVVAEKVAERYPDALVFLASAADNKTELDEEDPYKDFQIPDDLMW